MHSILLSRLMTIFPSKSTILEVAFKELNTLSVDNYHTTIHCR